MKRPCHPHRQPEAYSSVLQNAARVMHLEGTTRELWPE